MRLRPAKIPLPSIRIVHIRTGRRWKSISPRRAAVFLLGRDTKDYQAFIAGRIVPWNGTADWEMERALRRAQRKGVIQPEHR